MEPGGLYNEYLLAIERAQRDSMIKAMVKSPRERHRNRGPSDLLFNNDVNDALEKATRGSIIASMVPDEIILQHSNYAIRQYETALMLIDISGFTDLCETYMKADQGGPSRLTQVLNSYIGAMVQEILTHGGDVMNFSGDAILSMWKRLPSMTLPCVVHATIDCGLSVQKNYGTYLTDVGVCLKVKVAISAGISNFALIGDTDHSHYVILGQPVWDVKIAEYLASAGDVLTSPSAWMHVNEAEYVAEPLGDGSHTKVLHARGSSWKRFSIYYDKGQPMLSLDTAGDLENYYKEFSLRPVIISALRSSWWPTLRKFMVQPVIWAVEHDEPMEFLTEIRHVVIVFLNVITKTVTDELLVDIVDNTFKCVFSVSSASGGFLNKVSMFDKDMMFLLVFGLRGMTDGDEAQKSLLCAQALKESLVDPNFISVSIGISCGTTYCGVLGHVLRREYTVIGRAVNKAARLMTTYPNKLTCDKETYLRSKMDQGLFRLMESRQLKGIKSPGPVYEFNQYGWPEKPIGRRQPILGRDDELRVFILTLQKAMQQQHQPFTRYRDHVYGVVFLGRNSIGKTRLMEECIHLTPNCIRVVRINLMEKDKVPYGLFRQIALKTLAGSSSERNKCENKIRTSLDIDAMTPVQLYALNVIFGCRLPLPKNVEVPGDILAEHSIKNVVRKIFEKNISSLCIVAIEEAAFTDDESWRLLLTLLDTKTIFVIMTIINRATMSGVGQTCLSNNMLLKMPLSGLSPQYHSVIACHILDVQAIPADLEKLIQSVSDGMPGWIQNFIISLVQQGSLSVATVEMTKALEQGAVVPAPSLLFHKSVDLPTECNNQASLDEYFKGVLDNLNCGDTEKNKSGQRHAPLANDHIQIAVLSDTFEVLNIHMSMDVDAMIMKTYDSLTPFEKLLLKCSSVLGVVFSRRMMQYLIECDSPRKIAQAVAKLFSIRVLECEGGDFTHNTSKVLVHASPEVADAQPPYCSCLGTKLLSDCADLPKYAFCGYMRFKYPLFRTITYELLTETQKCDMHARALLYLQHYTRRCWYCGEGCFHKMMGRRTNDGLIEESAELRNTHQMIRPLAEETKHVAGEMNVYTSAVGCVFRSSLAVQFLSDGPFRRADHGREILREPKTLHRVRSFASLDVANCECLSIALFVYDQIIEHCRGAGEYEQLFESYLEYADLCVMNSNIPQALRLLNEAETFLLVDLAKPRSMLRYTNMQPFSSNDYWTQVNCKVGWFKEFHLGRIVSLRGGCMLESGELIEARKHLHRAMELFGDPFPTTKCRQKIRNMWTTMRQWMALKVAPKYYVGTESGLVGFYYEEVAVTLNRLYKLFTESKEQTNAELASKWSFGYAVRSNSNFQLLCESYGNMITTYLNNQEFTKCVKLEKLAMELCRRKRGQLDDAEARSICVLYSSVFLFYVEYGKKSESLEYCMPVLNMGSKLREPSRRERLVVRVLRLLLSDLRVAQMVLLMRESLYMGEQYDLSCALVFTGRVLNMGSKLREPSRRERLVVRVLRLLLSDLRIAQMVLLMRESLYMGEQYDLSCALVFTGRVLNMGSKLREPSRRERLVVRVLRLLLSDLRIAQMVLLMRESLYMGEQYDLSSTTWYYAYSMVILIETGYCVESYQACERFYMKHGDTILRSKSKEAAWKYFGCMWLITVRVSAWERSVLWEEKVKDIISLKEEDIQHRIQLQLILLEGLLIMLVREMDAMNVTKIAVLKDTVQNMFDTLNKCCRRAPIYLPRYYLLLSYFCFIRGKKFRARNYLEKTFVLAKELAEGTILIWAEHTRQHWTGTLDPALEDYWTEHIEPDDLLDYRDFNEHKGFIPFTLPLPKALEK